jgi:hypothetical protein
MKSWRQRKDEELDAEIRSHLAEAVRDRIARGETPDEARARALREFGNVGLVKEVTREMWGWGWLERLGQDLRFGARMLMKQPGFTLIAVLTLALGIGANTAIFSIVKSVLIQPLPFAQPDRLMQPRYRTPPHMLQGDWLSWIERHDLVDWRMRNRSFERIGGYRTNAVLALPGEESPEVIRGVEVTSDLLPALGIQPTIGRHFLPEEARPGGDRAIILSDDLWRRRRGSLTVFDRCGAAGLLDSGAAGDEGRPDDCPSHRVSAIRFLEMTLAVRDNDWQQRQTVFANLAGYWPDSVVLTGAGEQATDPDAGHRVNCLRREHSRSPAGMMSAPASHCRSPPK